MNSTDTLASNTATVSRCNQLHNSATVDVCNQLHKPLDDRVAFYADASRSSATHRAYASDMAAFFAWVGRVPASPEAVASYLAPPTRWPPRRYVGASRPWPTPTRSSAILIRRNILWSAKSSGASVEYMVLVRTLPRPSTWRCWPGSSQRCPMTSQQFGTVPCCWSASSVHSGGPSCSLGGGRSG